MSLFRPVMAEHSLAGQRIWITGAGSGIGRAVAVRLAQLGAHVGGCGRRCEPLAETQALVEATGSTFEWTACDVRETVRARMALDAFASKGLHGLVNNAGGQFHARAGQHGVNSCWQAECDLDSTRPCTDHDDVK